MEVAPHQELLSNEWSASGDSLLWFQCGYQRLSSVCLLLLLICLRLASSKKDVFQRALSHRRLRCRQDSLGQMG